MKLKALIIKFQTVILKTKHSFFFMAFKAFADYCLTAIRFTGIAVFFTRRNRKDKQDKQYLFHNHILSKNN